MNFKAQGSPENPKRVHVGLRSRAAWAAAIVGALLLAAVPWLWQECVPAGWLGIAVGLVLVTGRRGWRVEAAVLVACVLAITLAFHWTPRALAGTMRSSTLVGFAFAAPIILWDACRLALPIWAAGRMASDPRTAWLPAALVAVVAESLMPAVFPWKFGYSQLAWPVTVQSAALVGSEGPTFTFFAIVGTIIAVASVVAGRPAGRLPAIAVAAIALTVANLVYGAIAIGMVDARMAAAPTIHMALVQADPDQDSGIDTLRRLTREACTGDPHVDLVAWPECSGGFYEEGLDSFADEATVVRRSREPKRGLRPLPDPPCPLLLGGCLYRGFRERPTEMFQAALLIDADERLSGSSLKRHLMPFGEYVPWADVVPELRLFFPMETRYDRGPTATVIPCGAARIGTLLCYEDMIPSAAASLVGESANVLVALIHGAAFTNQLTLRQHRLLAQARSIENRRMLLRCSSTGETCVIDAAGRITARLPLGTDGVLFADVPLLEGQTLANRLGPTFPIACGLALVALVARKLRSPR
jgi:apolipoprotein N-acyltransferase